MIRHGFLSILALMVAASAQAQANGDRLEPLVADMPRNSVGLPMYWLEMESAVGWEKMVLVFGYADNNAPCARLQELAHLDSPDRNFRCVVAN